MNLSPGDLSVISRALRSEIAHWGLDQAAGREAEILLRKMHLAHEQTPAPEAVFAYVGRRRPCGCIVACVVDREAPPGITKKEVAITVAEFIESGLDIEHVTIEFARTHFKRCPHKKA